MSEGKKNVITVCCKCGLYAQDNGLWTPQRQLMAQDCVIINGLCPQCIRVSYPKCGKKDSSGTLK